MIDASANHISSIIEAPFKTVYVINPEQYDQLPSHVISSIKLSTVTLASLYSKFELIRHKSNKFVVFLDHPEWSDKLQEILVHCLFCPNYLFIANRPVVMINTSPRSQHDGITEFLTRLRGCLDLQGYHGIIEWLTDEKQISPDKTLQPLIITPDLKAEPEWVKEHLLKDFQSLTNYVIFNFGNVDGAVISEQSIKAACETYLHSNPQLSPGLRDYIALEETAGFLNAQNENLQQQIAGAEKTIGVIKTKYKDDYENLFKWYHNEYEILPLWYKRFGHILKVIMGKRSFRSLFSDDVKKYKS